MPASTQLKGLEIGSLTRPPPASCHISTLCGVGGSASASSTMSHIGLKCACIFAWMHLNIPQSRSTHHTHYIHVTWNTSRQFHASHTLRPCHMEYKTSLRAITLHCTLRLDRSVTTTHYTHYTLRALHALHVLCALCALHALDTLHVLHAPHALHTRHRLLSLQNTS